MGTDVGFQEIECEDCDGTGDSDWYFTAGDTYFWCVRCSGRGWYYEGKEWPDPDVKPPADLRKDPDEGDAT